MLHFSDYSVPGPNPSYLFILIQLGCHFSLANVYFSFLCTTLSAPRVILMQKNCQHEMFCPTCKLVAAIYCQCYTFQIILSQAPIPHILFIFSLDVIFPLQFCIFLFFMYHSLSTNSYSDAEKLSAQNVLPHLSFLHNQLLT